MRYIKILPIAWIRYQTVFQKPKAGKQEPGILPPTAANNRTSVWHIETAMGLHLYTNERKRTRAHRSKPDDDVL